MRITDLFRIMGEKVTNKETQSYLPSDGDLHEKTFQGYSQ